MPKLKQDGNQNSIKIFGKSKLQSLGYNVAMTDWHALTENQRVLNR